MDQHEQARRVAELAFKMSEELADKGQLVEGGWLAMKMILIPSSAHETQLSEMRKAFYFGAEHVYSSIMSIMDSDRDPTAKDLERMSRLDEELRKFKLEICGFKS